jgi:hypothetical protein
MSLVGRFKTLAQQETPTERNKRMLPGIMYGLIIASTYALVNGFANQLTFPDLPIGVDWRTLLPIWLFFSAWLGLGSGLINWFTQSEESFLPGLLVMEIGALGASVFLLGGNLPAQTGKLMLIILPSLAVSLLMTIALRWFGERHIEMLEKKSTTKVRAITTLTVSALIIGGVAGYGLNRWSDTTLGGVRGIHGRLQTAISDPSQLEALFPLNDVPELETHLYSQYTLFGRPAGQSVVGSEVTVNFRDGYRITCVLLVFPDKPPFLRACAEGDEVILPDHQ